MILGLKAPAEEKHTEINPGSIRTHNWLRREINANYFGNKVQMTKLQKIVLILGA